MAQIHVEHCAIEKARVDILILAVSGKSMTLSVFRQLPAIHSKDITLNDDIWGWVNYHHRDICSGSDPKEHLHGLAVKSGHLMRFLAFKNETGRCRFLKHKGQVYLGH